MFCYLWGNFENHHFLSQTPMTNFWATFEYKGQHFISTSGHTGATEDEPRNIDLPTNRDPRSIASMAGVLYFKKCDPR